MTTTQREVHVQADKLEPRLARAYLADIALIVNAARVADIEAQSVDVIMRSLGINGAAFGNTLEVLRTSYLTGGNLEFSNLPVALARIRFDVRSARAERWLSENSANLITRILESQRDVIRETLVDGMIVGRNPRNTALNLVGRVGTNGRRQGGLIGMTPQQAEFVRNARRQLESGDGAQMRAYLTRELRDRRYDRRVIRAIEQGTKLKQSDVQSMITQYSNRMLQHRGEMIARNEVIEALEASRNESYEQLIERGGVDANNIEKTWKTASDDRVRHTHAEMNNQKVKFNEPFISPTGAMMMYPHDASLGAPASELVLCRCTSLVKVNFIAEAMRNG